MVDTLTDHPALVAAGRLRARLSLGLSYRWAHLDDPAASATATDRWRGIRDEYLSAILTLGRRMTEADLTVAAAALNEQVNRAWLGGDWEADWAEPSGRYMAAYDALHYTQAVETLATLDSQITRRAAVKEGAT